MIRKDDFMCICSPESKAEAEDCYERVLAEVCRDGEHLVTGVVFALQWGLSKEGLDESYVGVGGFVGSIDSIYCDQWSMVTATVQRDDADKTGYVDHAYIVVQCDIVEHGIARVWELAKEACAEREIQAAAA